MTIKNKTELKAYFETDDRPTQSEFGDLIDSACRISLKAFATVAEADVTGFVRVIGSARVTCETPGSAGYVLLNTESRSSAQDYLLPGDEDGKFLGSGYTFAYVGGGNVQVDGTTGELLCVDVSGISFIAEAGVSGYYLQSASGHNAPFWSKRVTKYESTYNAFVVSSTYSFNHALSAVPDLVSFWLKCISDDAGFVTGNELPFHGNADGWGTQQSGPITARMHVPMIYTSGINRINVAVPAAIIFQNPTSLSVPVTISAPNWQLKISCVVF